MKLWTTIGAVLWIAASQLPGAEDPARAADLHGMLLAQAAPAPDKAFQWSFEKDGAAPPAAAQPDAAPPAAVETAPAGTVNADAYNDLLKENLKLRQDLDKATQGATTAQQQKDRMALEIRDLEGRLQEFTAKVEELKKQKSAVASGGVAPNPDRVVELESQLSAAEAAKADMAKQLAAAKEGTTATPAGNVQPGSDLFRKMEQENASLRQKLVETEAARANAAGAQQTAKTQVTASSQETEDLKAKLSQAEADKETQRQTIEKLTRLIPQMEQELDRLRGTSKPQTTAASAKSEADLEAMRAELDRREQRIIKAERIVELLAKTNKEIKAVTDREQRDMHYNMAEVYAKEGRYKDAEQEYLHALRIDPTDADTHYNLAILYDDVMKNNLRAAMHYRKYLQLRPHAEDKDVVRLWLLRTETSEAEPFSSNGVTAFLHSVE